MNNPHLKNLIKKSCLHPEDSKNIVRIFGILSDDRQKHILNHWNEIVFKIKASREKMEIDKEKAKNEFKKNKDKKDDTDSLLKKKREIFN